MKPITIDFPSGNSLVLGQLLLDFTGTLSQDGILLEGVAGRLTCLAEELHITVMTADTFGKAAEQLKSLPVDVQIIKTGQDKANYARQLGPANVATIGNGRNDVAMTKVAALSIAVIGPEGAAGELLQHAQVVVRDINEALDLLANPLRLKATLRD
jgi:soluble P-type ATPase